jgi:CYTH domain-containing protein
MLEIERKYLVKSLDFIQEAKSMKRITQGFLNTHPERTVRIRISGEAAFITVKGISNASGTTRMEWERSIDVSDAKELLKICEPGIIDKTRYEVLYKNYVFEVDVFHGENEGLIIAEIELRKEDETFDKPSWLGTEVTGNRNYYNSQLTKNPYKSWINY